VALSNKDLRAKKLRGIDMGYVSGYQNYGVNYGHHGQDPK
jgi:hypothetical protein